MVLSARNASKAWQGGSWPPPRIPRIWLSNTSPTSYFSSCSRTVRVSGCALPALQSSKRSSVLPPAASGSAMTSSSIRSRCRTGSCWFWRGLGGASIACCAGTAWYGTRVGMFGKLRGSLDAWTGGTDAWSMASSS